VGGREAGLPDGVIGSSAMDGGGVIAAGARCPAYRSAGAGMRAGYLADDAADG
jgi:hypothetical protein